MTDDFRKLYGDYYVAGYVLGGESAAMLSQSSDSSSTVEKLSLTVSVHALFWDASHTEEHVSMQADQHAEWNVVGFDTLTGTMESLSSGKGGTLKTVRETCLKFAALGKSLPNRVEKKIQDCGLIEGQPVSWEHCEKSCMEGLVVELIVMPWVTSREFMVWSTSTDII